MDGIRGDGRWTALQSLGSSVLNLSETHADELLQSAWGSSRDGWWHLWGAPSPPHEKRGVSQHVATSSFWAARPMVWNDADGCHRFFRDARLSGALVWAGDGHSSHAIAVYCVYGPAGARWDQSIMAYLDALLEAVALDAASRGLPAIIGGDFNAQPHESPVLSRLLSCGWRDAIEWAPAAHTGGTSTIGAEARIDVAIVNSSAARLLRGYALGPRDVFPGHRPITLSFDLRACSQQVLRAPPLFEDPYSPLFEAGFQDRVVSLPDSSHFRSLVATGDVEGAAGEWNRLAEVCLRSLAVGSGVFVGSGRGRISLHHTTLAPKCFDGNALSDVGSALLKVIRRCRELLQPTIPAERFRHTWRGLGVPCHVLPSHLQRLLRSTRSVEPDLPLVRSLLALFSCEFEASRRDERALRLKQWASRMRSSDGQCHKWIKRTPPPQGAVMRRASDEAAPPTANFSEQLKDMSSAWDPVFNRFKEASPDVSAFLAQFGQHIRTSPLHCSPLSGDMLREAVLRSSLSAPGLDGWSFSALRALVSGCPKIFDELAVLLRLVEDSGVWPQSFVTASVSLIPKDPDIAAPLPSELRPLTILSAVYRVWAKARLPALLDWQELWLPDEAWGFRPGRSAEGLFFCTALEMEMATVDGLVAAGISFDLRKAFDHIPTDLLIKVLEVRGCAPCILRPLSGLYRQMQRRFRLRGVLGPAFSSANGIPQGDPLSPVCLNALLSVWLEALAASSVAGTARSFADDLSVLCTGGSVQAVSRGLRQAFSLSRAFAESIGAQFCPRKTCTFGDSAVEGTVPGISTHSADLRLVGGSILAGEAGLSPSALDEARRDKWSMTISRIRLLPVSWQQRCRILQSTVTQAVWGHGTHPGYWSKDSLRTLRTQVLAALWQGEHWLASPLLVLTLLAPPAIDPSFAFPFQCICTLGRLLCLPRVLHLVRRLFALGPGSPGPVGRLHNILRDHPCFRPLVEAALRDPSVVGPGWRRQLRDAWRVSKWQSLRRDRPDFAGIENGVNRDTSLHCLRTWMSDADALQSAIDAGKASNPTEPRLDVRARLGVLRRLLTGGLNTRDRDSRHRKHGPSQCSCGLDVESVLHVS